ncbi:unnamed protein product [Closterium sp. Yama58-4]|nr:unnamed protein product [Closterium sp. Yama58-4]
MAVLASVQNGALASPLASAQPAATSGHGGCGSRTSFAVSASSRRLLLLSAESAAPAAGPSHVLRQSRTRTSNPFRSPSTLSPNLLRLSGHYPRSANKRSSTVTVTATAAFPSYGIPGYSSPSAEDAASIAGSHAPAARPSSRPATGASSGGKTKQGPKRGDSKIEFRNPWLYQSPSDYASPRSYVSPQPYGIRLTTAPEAPPKPSARTTSPAPPTASPSPSASASPAAPPLLSAALSAAEGAVRERGGAFMWGWAERGLGGVSRSLARVWVSVGAVAVAVAVSTVVRLLLSRSLPAVLPALLAASALALASALLPSQPVLASHTITAILSYLLAASLQVVFSPSGAPLSQLVLGLPAFLGALLAAPALLYNLAHATAATTTAA